MFLEMERPVPNYLKVNAGCRAFVVQCEYQSVVRVYRKCGRDGHFSSNCNTPKCQRCGVFGHLSCTDPCPRCLSDHPLSECGRRTSAAALGFSRGLVPALDVVPDLNKRTDIKAWRPLSLLNTDYKILTKAFNHVDHAYMLHCLKKSDINESLITKIKT